MRGAQAVAERDDAAGHVVARLAAGADGREARQLVEGRLKLGGRDAQLEEAAAEPSSPCVKEERRTKPSTAVGGAEDRVGETVEVVRVRRERELG